MPNSAVLGGFRRFGAVLIFGGGGELGSNWGQRGGVGDYGDFLLNVMKKMKLTLPFLGLREFLFLLLRFCLYRNLSVMRDNP